MSNPTNSGKSGIEIDLKVPLTWVLASLCTLILTTAWAGWKANEVISQLQSIAHLTEKLVNERDGIKAEVIEHKMDIRQLRSEVGQLKVTIDELKGRQAK